MNKKNGILFIVCLMLTINLFAQEQDKKNIVGFGYGISLAKDYSVWIGDPVDVWANKNIGQVIQLFYARQLMPSFRLGSYFEYEHSTCSFEIDEFDGSTYYMYDIVAKASRYNIGLNWLSQYPKKAFHAQLGGYMGYGILSSSNMRQALNGTSGQNLSGIDFGLMLVPAYEKGNYGIALHAQSGFGCTIATNH